MAENLYIPEISGPLRSFMLKVPEEIQQASGIRVMGKLIIYSIYNRYMYNQKCKC